MLDWIAYRWRRFGIYGSPCTARRCGRERVGLSIWCRRHTDAIMAASFEECRERLEELDLDAAALRAEVEAARAGT